MVVYVWLIVLEIVGFLGSLVFRLILNIIEMLFDC